MTGVWQSLDLSDPIKRRAVLASIVLHGLVLAGMGFYLLQANAASPKVGTIVFEFPKKVAPTMQKIMPVKPRVKMQVVVKAKPVVPKVKPPVARTVKPVTPRVESEVAVSSRLPKLVVKTLQPPLKLLKPSASQVIKLQQRSPLLAPSSAQQAILPNFNSSVAKPNLLRSNVTSTGGGEKISTNAGSSSSANGSGLARVSSGATSGAEKLQLASVRSSAAQPGDASSPFKAGAAGASLAPETSGLAGGGGASSSLETNAPSSLNPTASQAATGGLSGGNGQSSSSLDSRPSGTPVNTPSGAKSSRPGQTGSTPGSSAASGLSAPSNRPGSTSGTDTKPTAVGASASSTAGGGLSKPKPGTPSSSAAGNGLASSGTGSLSGKDAGLAGSGSTGSSSGKDSGLAGSGSSGTAGGRDSAPTGSGTSTSLPGSGGAPSSKPASSTSLGSGDKPSTPSAPSQGQEKSPIGSGATQSTGVEGSKPATGAIAGSERTALGCAILVDARGLNPPLTPSESPAIVNPSNQKVWPDPDAIQGVDSNLVGETGIASFATSQDQALGFLAVNVQSLTVKAIKAVPADGVQNSVFRDYVMVSASDAAKIAALGRNCQVVFIK